MNMKKLVDSACLILVILALAFAGCMEKSSEEDVDGAVSDDDSVPSDESIPSEEGATGSETGSEDGIVNITDEVCEDRPIKLTACPPEPEPLEL